MKLRNVACLLCLCLLPCGLSLSRQPISGPQSGFGDQGLPGASPRLFFGGAPGYAVMGALAAPLLLMGGLGTITSLAPSVANSVQAMFARPPAVAAAAPAAAAAGSGLLRKTSQRLKSGEFWKVLDQYAAVLSKVMKEFDREDDW